MTRMCTRAAADRPPRRNLVALALGVLALTTACSVDAKRDVVLVTIDTLRADRLGCYGSEAGLTPNLDRFSAGSTLFENAVAPTPITLPSHASLFTGRYPTATGVRNNGTFVLPEAESTLAELVREAGWSTAAVVAAYPLHGRYGLAQGFERYDDHLPAVTESSGTVRMFYPERTADEVTARALRTWREMGPGPKFLWAHYFDPHEPHDAPEPFASLEAASGYDREVAFLDAELGKLLQEIETSSPDAIIVVTSDHGESLGEHGEDTHGIFIYESTLSVPLLVRAPGLLPATRISTPVSLVDVLPTLLGLLDLPLPAGTQGADLQAVAAGAPPSRPLYAESYLPHLEYRTSPLTMLRDGNLKYVAAPLPELFDLAADPGETVNLFGEHPEAQRLAGELDDFLATADAESSRQARLELDSESAARLRSLGYVAGGSTSIEAEPTRGRDPKTVIDLIQREDKAVNMIANGKVEHGLAVMRELVSEAPENYVSRFRIGAILLSVGRQSEAERELEAVVAQDPRFYPAVLTLAQTRGELGKLDEAIAGFEAAAELVPQFAEPHHEMGLMLESYGRFEEAAAAYVEALLREPSSFDIGRAIMTLRDGRGDLETGVAEIRATADRRPDSPVLWTILAEGSLRLGREQDAAAAIERALALDPGLFEARILEGELRLRKGRFAEAEDGFRRLVSSNPDSVPARFGLARALLDQDRRPQAEAELARILMINPEFSPAYTVRGRYMEVHGDPRGAGDAYRRALAVNPFDREAAEGLARVVGQP